MFGVQTMVVRSDDSNPAVWVVQWQGVRRENLLAKVQAAVWKWIQRGGKGKEVWEASGEGFNIYDLKNQLQIGDKELLAILDNEGVCGLTLDLYDYDTPHEGWFNYTILVPEDVQ